MPGSAISDGWERVNSLIAFRQEAMRPSPKHLSAFGNFILDPAKRSLLRNGRPLSLTPKVFAALLLLVENAGHVEPPA